MAQVKIYGYSSFLAKHRTALSDAIHDALVTALALPKDKRFHRFIPLEADDFIHPPERTSAYIIIEIIMFEGRSVETKKQLIGLLYEQAKSLGISNNDLELVILESPKHNWGIRGLPANELKLNYNVNL